MMRKLRAEGDGPGYTATGLCLVDWDDDHEQDERQVSVSLDAVPEDLRPDQFMERMVGQVLRVTPISHHVRVRERYEGRQIPVEESDEAVMAEPAERGEITQSGEPLF